MQLFYHYHHHKIHQLLHSEFWLFELSVWFHVFALSLISIFVPILLLVMGYSIESVILFYVLYNLFDVPLNFLARWLVKTIGARWVIILATIAAILLFSTFFTLTIDQWPKLILIALFAGIYDSFYWVAHLFLFIQSNKKESQTGKNTGILFIVKKIAGILGPAFGAVILLFFNQSILILVSIAFFAASIIPLFKIKGIDAKPKQKQKKFREFFQQIEEKKDYVSISLFSIHGSAENVIWPIFIFVIFGTIQSVAYVPIIISITTIIFTYFTSSVSKKDRQKLIVLGSALISIVWMMRLFFDNNLFYYFSIFLIGLFSVLITVPIDTNIFTRGKKIDILSASTYRNSFSMFAKFIFFGLLAILVSVFNLSFIIAALSMFVLMAVNYLYVLKTQKRTN